MCRNYTTLQGGRLTLSPSSAQESQSRRLIHTNTGVKVMGELLEIASWVGTPLGGIVAVAFVAALFFYGRWVLAEPTKKKG